MASCLNRFDEECGPVGTVVLVANFSALLRYRGGLHEVPNLQTGKKSLI